MKDLARKAAIATLNDEQRKGIKSVAGKFTRSWYRLLGVEQTLESLQGQIERLKSRLFALDGKFNLALLGVPGAADRRAVLAGDSPVDGLSAEFAPHPLFGGEAKFASALEWLRKLCAAKAGAQLALAADPLSTLLAHNPESYDLIICAEGFTWLSPLEQERFGALAGSRLKNGGTLAMLLPDLAHAATLADGYWRDPRNFRPYSLSALREALAAEGLKVDVTAGGEFGHARFLAVIARRTS